MSAVLEDQSVWDRFFPPLPPNHPPVEEGLAIDVLEWYSDATTNARVEPPIKTAKSLIAQDEDPNSTCTLRVVFLPRDSPDLSGDLALKTIYQHYAFPSAWLTERLRDVTHSFGGHKVLNHPNVDLAWMRLLCKNVQIRATIEVENLQVYDIVGAVRNPRGGSQDSSAWWHLDALVHTRKRADGSTCVTLLCFSQRQDIVRRFEQLLGNDSWDDAVEEPFLLFSILLEKWYLALDRFAWGLADVFRPIEILTLRRSDRRQAVRPFKELDDDNDNDNEIVIPDLDFAGLHNLSKHCTYLLEAASATLLVLENMAHHHRFLHTNNTTSLSTATATSLTYRKTALESTQLRLQSLQQRMSNLISLSFNLVTQEDSQTMKNDSHAMKAIAILTLIFLPLTGIGSVFSTPFFDVDFDSESRMLRVARSFWIFWAITIPLTGLLLGSWGVWYYQSKSGGDIQHHRQHRGSSAAEQGRGAGGGDDKEVVLLRRLRPRERHAGGTPAFPHYTC